MTKKICFLSCQAFAGKVADDQIAIDLLEKNGDYKVTSLPWDDEANWSEFDLVIIRTTWDYVQRPKQFIEKLALISSQTKLVNSLDVVKWNHHKGYLKELESKGINIVPTHMFKFPGEIQIPTNWNYQRFIVKPAISATAYKTMIVTRAEIESFSFKAEMIEGDWLLQPFLEDITHGEVSLYFFNNEFSHSIIKKPKSGDFRVQEEWGGDIQPYTPNESLLTQSQNLVDKIPHKLFYARVDVALWQGSFALMELELIEPALYFRKSDVAAKNFKAHLDKIFTTP